MYAVKRIVAGEILFGIAAAIADLELAAIPYHIEAGELFPGSVERKTVHYKILTIQKHENLAFDTASFRAAHDFKLLAVLESKIACNPYPCRGKLETLAGYVVQGSDKSLSGILWSPDGAIILQPHRNQRRGAKD
jgi:hypothetical protein